MGVSVKKIILAFIGVVLLIVLVIIFNSHFSKSARIGKENLRNIQRIEIGMDTSQVISIMGEANQRWIFKNEIFYDYDLPPGISGQLTLSIDSTGKVIHRGNIPPD
jgi:hypothetical protein